MASNTPTNRQPGNRGAPAAPDTSLLTWVHLSDLHFGQARNDATGQVDQAMVTRLILEDCRRLSTEIGRPDWVFVTGDVAFSGQPKEYELAAEWLRGLVEILGVGPDRILIVPGNHDVDRGKVLKSFSSRTVHQGLRMAPNEIDSLLRTESSGEFRANIWPKLEAFSSFHAKLRRQSEPRVGVDVQELDSNPIMSEERPFFVHQFAGMTDTEAVSTSVSATLRPPPVFLGLNSCLLSYDGEDSPKNLALGASQLEAVFSKIPADTLVIALIHHPAEWLKDGRDLTTRLQRHPHMLFSGHVHNQDGQVFHPLRHDGHVAFSAGAAHSPASEGPNHSYAWGQLRADGIHFFPRIWNASVGAFIPDRNAFPKADGDGRLVLPVRKLPEPLETLISKSSWRSTPDSSTNASDQPPFAEMNRAGQQAMKDSVLSLSRWRGHLRYTSTKNSFVELQGIRRQGVALRIPLENVYVELASERNDRPRDSSSLGMRTTVGTSEVNGNPYAVPSFDPTSWELPQSWHDLVPELPPIGDRVGTADVLIDSQCALDALAPEESQGDIAARPISAAIALLTSRMEGMADDSLESDRPLQLHDAVGRSPQCLILGDPGCGKTTLLRYLAKILSDAHLKGGEMEARARDILKLSPAQSIPFPLFTTAVRLNTECERQKIELGSFNIQQVRRLLQAELKSSDLDLSDRELTRLLDENRMMILVDGLDEVSTHSHRCRTAAIVEELVAAYPELRIVASSRLRALVPDLATRLCALVPYRVLPMGYEEIRRFLDAWFAAVWTEDPSRGRFESDALFSELQSHKEMRELATNPNVLTIVAILKYTRTRLPERRVELYREVFDLFLGMKDDARGLSGAWRESVGFDLDISERRLLVAQLALFMHLRQESSRQTPVDLVVQELARLLNHSGRCVSMGDARRAAEALIDLFELRTGLLRRVENAIEFSHLGYQEFGAAHALSVLDSNDAIWSIVKEHLLDDWWNEVIRLLLAMLENRSGWLLERLVTPRGLVRKDWKRLGRGLSIAMASVAEMPFLHVSAKTRNAIVRQVELLLGSDSNLGERDRVEALIALGRVGDPRLGLLKPENWISIPPGEFFMGSPDYADVEESPLHKVTLSKGFWTTRFPVTRFDIDEFVAAGGYREPRFWMAGGWTLFRGEPMPKQGRWEGEADSPNQPATGVSWYEAMAFCAWLSERFEQATSDQRPSFWRRGMRVTLPSEAKWERIANSGRTVRYPWGDSKPNSFQAEADCRRYSPHPVGAYPRNRTAEGVMDMVGSVGQWCLDTWHDSYTGAPDDGTAWLDGSTAPYRILRGTSRSFEPCGTVFERGWGEPDGRFRSQNIGFRCVFEQPDADGGATCSVPPRRNGTRLRTIRASFSEPSSFHILYWHQNRHHEPATIWLDSTDAGLPIVRGQTPHLILSTSTGDFWRWESFEKAVRLVSEDAWLRAPWSDRDSDRLPTVEKLIRCGRLVQTPSGVIHPLFVDEDESWESDGWITFTYDIDPIASLGQIVLIRADSHVFSGGAHGLSTVNFGACFIGEAPEDRINELRNEMTSIAEESKGLANALFRKHASGSLGGNGDCENPTFTLWRPFYDIEGYLTVSCQFTGGTCYAESDGRWHDYSRSVEVFAETIPASLQNYKRLPPALRAYFASNGWPVQPWGWSIIEKSPAVSESLTAMFAGSNRK